MIDTLSVGLKLILKFEFVAAMFFLTKCIRDTRD